LPSLTRRSPGTTSDTDVERTDQTAAFSREGQPADSGACWSRANADRRYGRQAIVIGLSGWRRRETRACRPSQQRELGRDGLVQRHGRAAVERSGPATFRIVTSSQTRGGANASRPPHDGLHGPPFVCEQVWALVPPLPCWWRISGLLLLRRPDLPLCSHGYAEPRSATRDAIDCIRVSRRSCPLMSPSRSVARCDRHGRRVPDAVLLVSSAKSHLRRLPPRLVSWLHSADAEVLAAAGHPNQARRALAAAETRMPDTPPERTSPTSCSTTSISLAGAEALSLTWATSQPSTTSHPRSRSWTQPSPAPEPDCTATWRSRWRAQRDRPGERAPRTGRRPRQRRRIGQIAPTHQRASCVDPLPATAVR
jgi:hypothetical protein